MKRSSAFFLPVVLLLAACAASNAAALDEPKEMTKAEADKEIFRQVQLFADSIALISTDYVEQVEAKDLIYGALRGMTGTLDGYSQFLDQESFAEITEETKGEFGGVGIEIGVRDDILTVISPIEDSPAFKAGIQEGDMIVKIDGQTTRDMTLDDAVKILKGKPGTKVNISVIREGTGKILEFGIERAIIKLKSIKESYIVEGDIGYIKLIEFQERSPEDLERSVRELVEKGAGSLILDLRSNPGGLLDSAIGSAELFLDKGTLIVYTQGRDPEKKVDYNAGKKALFPDIDMVLLVNKGSASASEILAGAIKDNKRGIIVGVPTFGKGSVQTVIPLMDKTALRLTTASYFTPSGSSLRDKGIEPDIYVEYRPKKLKTPEKGESARKTEVFSILEEEEGPGAEENGGKTGEEEKEMPLYDSQMETAVNLLKGLRIFEQQGEANKNIE